MSAERQRYPGAASSRVPRGRVMGGRYEVDRAIGEGASGTVYLAHRKTTGEEVALKVIHPHLYGDRQIFGRFQREAAILKRLEGVHLVKLLDFIEEDDRLIIALEHVEGSSLEDWVKEHAPVDLGDAVEIILQVCAALGAAHAGGVVHRDLKPANVLLERPGEGSTDSTGLHARVCDFGLAKVVHGEHMTTGLTEQDMIFGTPEYMAPEQARGDEVDARCDLYAAGVMLYEMAVGSVPFDGKTPIAKMTAHLAEEPTPPRARAPDRGISPALEAVMLRSLTKDPGDRYQSARAFAEALAAARDEPLVIAPHRDSDASGIGDTDLELSTTGLAHSPTLPCDPSEPPPAGARSSPPSEAKPPPTESSLRSSPPAEAASDKWVWTVVALVAAAIAVGLGVLFGAR